MHLRPKGVLVQNTCDPDVHRPGSFPRNLTRSIANSRRYAPVSMVIACGMLMRAYVSIYCDI